MAAKKEKTIKVYICGIDLDHEIGEVMNGTQVYPTVAALKKERMCWRECGIAELEVKVKKWVHEPEF